MKTVSIILSCCILGILLLSASAAQASSYVNLTVNTEKWFNTVSWSDTAPQRMHTVISPYQNGLVKMHREILQGQQVLSAEDRIFSRNSAGDVFYHGKLPEQLYEDPILWVDAPLTVGQTWKESRPVPANPGDVDTQIHFVFAVLEEARITCPAGAFECFRVFLSEIYPDGRVENCNFWYNQHCGIVSCSLQDSPVYQLVKAFVNNHDGDGIDPHFTDPEAGLLGGLTGVPNPANPMTSINFELKSAAAVDVEVFDISGRLVKRLAQGEFMAAGPVNLRWQGTDEQGRQVASGTYLFRVKAGQTVSTNRITLVR
jgi:hypothetical protein